MSLKELIKPLGKLASAEREFLLSKTGRHYFFDQSEVKLQTQFNEGADLVCTIYERPGPPNRAGFFWEASTPEDLTDQLKEFLRRDDISAELRPDPRFNEVFDPEFVHDGGTLYIYDDEADEVKVKVIDNIQYCSEHSVGFGQSGYRQAIIFSDKTRIHSDSKSNIFVTPEDVGSHIQNVVLPRKKQAIDDLVHSYKALEAKAKSLEAGAAETLNPPRLGL